MSAAPCCAVLAGNAWGWCPGAAWVTQGWGWGRSGAVLPWAAQPTAAWEMHFLCH